MLCVVINGRTPYSRFSAFLQECICRYQLFSFSESYFIITTIIIGEIKIKVSLNLTRYECFFKFRICGTLFKIFQLYNTYNPKSRKDMRMGFYNNNNNYEHALDNVHRHGPSQRMEVGAAPSHHSYSYITLPLPQTVPPPPWTNA